MRIAIASDHAAIALKSELAAWLTGTGHEIFDLTMDGADYADQGYRLAAHIADGRAERGVALCGSGVGI